MLILCDICLFPFNCACAAQIKEAVLSGVSLEDDKRDEFNKIEQVIFNTIAKQVLYKSF